MTHLQASEFAAPSDESVSETLRALMEAGPSKPKRALRAAGYTRVSTAMSVEEGTSLQDQEARIREHIRARGWQEVAVLSDPAQTGRTGKRPAFLRLQRLVRQRLIDVVVVDRIDRAYRNLLGLLDFIKVLNERKVKFVSLREQIDFDTLWGKLVLYVLGALAEFYSSALSQEIRLQRYHAARGGWLTGAFRFGYCKGNCTTCADPNGPGYCPRSGGPDLGNGKIRVHHPVEEAAVVLMFQWYATGLYSDDDVARRLNAEVFVLPDGTEVRFRTKGVVGRCPPGPFDRDAVRAILTNPIYVGVVTYAGSDAQGCRRRKPVDFFEGLHTPIVDLTLFRRAQTLRRNRYHRSQSERSPARTYPLSGLVFCAHAHSHMRGISVDAGSHRYYVDKLCQQTLPKSEWHQPNVPAESLEREVEALVTRIRLPQAWQERVLAYVLYDDGIAEVEHEKFIIRERLQRAVDLHRDGHYTRGQFERIRAECERSLAALVPARTPVGQEAATLLDNLALLWSALTDEEVNTLYRLILDGVYVRGKTIAEVEPRPAFREHLSLAAIRLAADTGTTPVPLTSAGETQGEGVPVA